MNTTRISGAVFDLRREEARRFAGAPGVAVTVLSGDLWLTQERDDVDRVLGSGDEFVLDREGVAVVQALEGPALVRIDAPPSRAGGDRQDPRYRTTSGPAGVAAIIGAALQSALAAAIRAADRAARAGVRAL